MIQCLTCEGRGVVREILDRAGDYYKWHCPACRGTGLMNDGGLKLKPVHKPRDPSEPRMTWRELFFGKP